MGNLTGRHEHAVIIVLYSGFLSLLFWDLQRLIMIFLSLLVCVLLATEICFAYLEASYI